METKFKQAIRLLSMAALALLMAACSEDDNTTGQPAQTRGIPFTATLSNGGSQTRTLSGPNSNVITATWADNEEVALVYKVGDETKVTKATVTAVSDGTDGKTAGTATITATLDENVTTGTDVTLIYPYSAVNQTAGDDYGKVRNNVFEGQAGTLAYISANCDLRKGEGKITLSTGSATLKDNVTMASQIAIWKIYLNNGGYALSATKLDPYFGGMTASAAKTDGSSSYTIAVPAGSTGLTILATADDGTYIYNKSSVTLNPSTYYESDVTLTKQTTRTITTSDGDVTLNDGDIVTGTGGANTQLKIAVGATVTLAGVTNMDFNNADNSINQGCRTGIECQGSATIILADGTTNTFKGHWERAAVYIPSGNTLTIRGGGTLIADNTNCGASGAGIGGSFRQDCGNIVIEGGNITAKGSSSAGIGGGNHHSCGTITIKGGTINATGSGDAAGIGSGREGSCGAITISGGTVTATGTEYCAGIGGGKAFSSDISCGAITISGGTVKATGGAYAAGIGSGNGNNDGSNIYVSSCGAISITGGTVDATGGNRAAGIGSGSDGKFASISIGSGITSVTATRSNNYWNVPIGKGNDDQGSGAVTIDGQTLTDAQTKGTTNTTFGSINVAVSPYGTNNGLTWTLTPKN
jgi:hypothetical protein